MVRSTGKTSAAHVQAEPAAAQAFYAGETAQCFHCGEAVPPGCDFSIEIRGARRPMCCPGCRAVASLIADSGLEDFYNQRTGFNLRPEPLPAGQDFSIYDDPALHSSFSSEGEGEFAGLAHVRLLLGGVTCAACTWLIENSLGRVPGVASANVHLGQSRLDVHIDPAQLRLSELMQRVAAMGYTVRPYHSSARQQQIQAEYRGDLRRLAVAGLGMMQVGMFAIALHAGDLQGITAQYQSLLRWVSLPVTAFVVAFSARPFFNSAWRHLRQGALVMDLPVSLAISLAFIASTWATLSGSGQVYFDSVVMFTFLLLLARFVEKRIRQRDAFRWHDTAAALPDAVLCRRGDAWTTLPRQQVTAGERVLVRAGDTVPVDGRVLSGRSAVREDTFTGEPLPRPVQPGDTVHAGTLNTEDALELEATGTEAQSRLTALQRSVEHAAGRKPRIAQLADRVAAWFIGGILLATAATALFWYGRAPEQAFWIALSVLVVSCPCALALATPAALSNAASALRRHGVIVRGENALETLPRVSDVVFDKTGTLTAGALRIARVERLCDAPEHRLLSLCAAMQRYSSHPVAAAFSAIDAAADVDAVRYHIGEGLSGHCCGRSLRLGSPAFCRQLAPALGEPPAEALYWIALCSEDQPLAWIGLQDSLRAEVPAVLGELRARGLRLHLLTGDSSAQGAALAKELRLDTVHCGLSPDGKSEQVAALQAQGRCVLMVGDGLNDAPVLGRADVSIAVTEATDMARAQADLVLLAGDLGQLSGILDTATHCRRVIRQNLGWALGYNALGIPLAALGHIPPWAAALGMSASSLLVVGNAMRLSRSRARPH
jgi:Cu2+-exporting ATPase